MAAFAAAVVIALAGLPGQATARIRHIEYADLPAGIQHRLAAGGIPGPRFADYIQRVDAETSRRVADGEREHFIYYALQSTQFTSRAPIEPAVSARRFVDSLEAEERRRLLDDPGYLPARGWPDAERARMGDAIARLTSADAIGPRADVRLLYFKELFAPDDHRSLVDGLYADYVRIARFLYKKEFESGGSAAAVAALYHTRPHSSDTGLEAGFGVYLGLGTLHALEPERRIRRVLIVGPGLDFAPRTDLIDSVAPQSYQPFAVADALLALSIGSDAELTIDSVDINPRVVNFIERVAREPLVLHLFTGIGDTAERPLSLDYRDYLGAVGRAIGRRADPPAGVAPDRRYLRSVRVNDSIRHAMRAERLNIVTARFVDRQAYDLVVITNVLTYVDDRQLALALCNIAAMLGPGGYLLHNESRAGLVEIAAAAQLPTVQMRTAVIAGSSPHPLYDTIWLHQKTRTR